MAKPKILMVEDEDSLHKMVEEALGDRVAFLKALTLKEGQKLFRANPDIFIVVMDACVPGNSPNSQYLVRKIRETFSGPMIATSSVPAYREELLAAGCDYECPKESIPKMVLDLIDVS